MENAPWQTMLGLNVVTWLLTLGANILVGIDSQCEATVVFCGTPAGTLAADVAVAWEEISWNPITVLITVFQTIKSIAIALGSLIILNYELMNGPGWMGAIGTLLQAISGLSGAILFIQMLVAIRS